jgi:hypothetical protein
MAALLYLFRWRPADCPRRQTFLLINEVNLKEEKCTVVREVSTCLDRIDIVVKFPQPVPNFWETSRP